MTEVLVTVNKPTVTVVSPTAATVTVSDVHDKIVLNKFDPAYIAVFDATTQTDGGGTTSSQITFSNQDINYDFGFANNTFTFLRSGTFMLQYSAQLRNSATSIQDVNIFLKKNNQVLPESSTYVSIPNSHGGSPGDAVSSVTYVQRFTANDTLQFWWYSTSTSCQLATIAAQASGPEMPRSPSIIVTIAQIS